MRADEVFQALLGTRPNASRSLDLNVIQQACDLDSFGVPPRPEILKAILAMSGVDPSKRLEDLEGGATNQLVSADAAIEALQRTVAFLQAAPNLEEPGPGIPAYGFTIPRSVWPVRA